MSCFACQRNKKLLEMRMAKKKLSERTFQPHEFVFKLTLDQYLCIGPDANGNELVVPQGSNVDVFMNGNLFPFRTSSILSYPGWEFTNGRTAIMIIPPVKVETEIKIKIINR